MAKSQQETLTRRMLIKRYAVTSGKGFKLRGIDPRDTLGLKEKDARAALAKDVERLARAAGEALRPGPLGRAARSSRRWTPPARTARSST